MKTVFNVSLGMLLARLVITVGIEPSAANIINLVIGAIVLVSWLVYYYGDYRKARRIIERLDKTLDRKAAGE